MAAMLNWIANATIDGTRYDSVQVLVRAGELTVSDARGPQVVRQGVVAVEGEDPLVRTIVFDNGDRYAVTRVTGRREGCGCQ